MQGEIAVEEKHRLAEVQKGRHQRIVLAQQHLVIELLVDPVLDHALDVAEVAHHIAAVELAGTHLDLGDCVVPVRVLADPVVVEQPMTVTEIDAFSDRIHFGHCMPTAVLLSGGLDSAVLLAEEAGRGDVQPIYVSVGLAWERAERETVAEVLAWPALRQRVRPLASLSVDMRDVYAATHWAVVGKPPGYHTPDEDVNLPGRNIVLLGKAAVYCTAAT